MMLATALMAVGLPGASSAAPAPKPAAAPSHGAFYVHSFKRGSASAATAATAAVVSSKLVAPGGGIVTPDGCQGTVSTMTLETLSRGYNYNCSGVYTNSSGQTTYHLFTGNWSGILYTYSGSTEHDYYYCDGASISIPYYTVVEIWLSATRTSWC
jgi:hypothetical protein